MLHLPSRKKQIRGSQSAGGTDRPVQPGRLAPLVLIMILALSLVFAACGTGATTVLSTQAPGQSGTTGATAGATTGGIVNMKIDAKQAREMLNANKNAILLDVRTVEENREQRIPGSTLIPIQELPGRLNELPKDPNRPILVYCRSGNRSAQAAAILKQAGFPAVYDFGGIIDWPYETEKG